MAQLKKGDRVVLYHPGNTNDGKEGTIRRIYHSPDFGEDLADVLFDDQSRHTFFCRRFKPAYGQLSLDLGA